MALYNWLEEWKKQQTGASPPPPPTTEVTAFPATGTTQTGLDQVRPSDFGGIPEIGTPEFGGIPDLPGQAQLPEIGMTAPERGFDIAQDPYAQAALSLLGETQETGLSQFRETMRQMGLRGAGDVGDLSGDFIRQQQREKALLGGELSERARTGALAESAQTGFLGGTPTMQREQMRLNAVVQQAGIDLNRFQAGAMSELEKEKLLLTADQYGVSRALIESQVKQAETSFDENVRRYDQEWNQALSSRNEAKMASSMYSSVSTSMSRASEGATSHIAEALQKGDPSKLSGWTREQYDTIMKKINAAPPEMRDSLMDAAMRGLTAAYQPPPAKTGAEGLLEAVVPTVVKTGAAIATGGAA